LKKTRLDRNTLLQVERSRRGATNKTYSGAVVCAFTRVSQPVLSTVICSTPLLTPLGWFLISNNLIVELLKSYSSRWHPYYSSFIVSFYVLHDATREGGFISWALQTLGETESSEVKRNIGTQLESTTLTWDPLRQTIVKSKQYSPHLRGLGKLFSI
jgi:hypothetical protein